MVGYRVDDAALRDLVRREWGRLLDEAGRSPLSLRDTSTAAGHDAGEAEHDCPLLPLLPDLMPLIEELHHRPVEQLVPMIRRMLLERDFVDENGDSVIAAGADESSESHAAFVEREVQTLARVLGSLRRDAFERGAWSDAPVTPIMFG